MMVLMTLEVAMVVVAVWEEDKAEVSSDFKPSKVVVGFYTRCNISVYYRTQNVYYKDQKYTVNKNNSLQTSAVSNCLICW